MLLYNAALRKRMFAAAPFATLGVIDLVRLMVNCNPLN